MVLTKKDFDAQLKKDAVENKFSIEANYIVFDKGCNLLYEVIPGYTLAVLLTKNPIASYTKLSKDLLLALNTFTAGRGKVFEIGGSYRSPEYSILFPDRVLASSGKCLDLIDYSFVKPQPSGVLFTLYNWGFNFALGDGDSVDFINENTIFQKVINFFAPDIRRNFAAYGVLALTGFIFFKNLFK